MEIDVSGDSFCFCDAFAIADSGEVTFFCRSNQGTKNEALQSLESIKSLGSSFSRAQLALEFAPKNPASS